MAPCTLTYRLKVPGGWLVRSTETRREFFQTPGGVGGLGVGVGSGLTFLPDANHAWAPSSRRLDKPAAPSPLVSPPTASPRGRLH